MITHNVKQGTPEWHALRKGKHTASEAPAMMGVSKYKSRTELLNEKKSGITPEITPAVQKLFDKGHAVEESARSIAESIVGEDLYPATGEHEDTGQLASFDGITMLGDVIWEHKLINDNLRNATVETLDEQYKVQMDQQLFVSGAEKCLFMASDGTENDMVHFWYTTTQERIEAVKNGWKQLDIDLENHEIAEPEIKPVGASIETLPSLAVKVEGKVIASNLDSFKSHALGVIESINTDLQTDQDFADAETAVKWCKDVEKRLEDAEGAIMSQTADIDTAIRTLRDVKEATRQRRLSLDKLVKAQKEAIKRQIALDAKNDWCEYRDKLESDLLSGRVQIYCQQPDIAEAMKNKRTLDSLRDAANTEVSRAKIEVKSIIEHAAQSLEIIDKANRPELFRDLSELVQKDHEALEHIVSGRVAEADEKERKRLAEMEAQKEKEVVHNDLHAGTNTSGTPMPECPQTKHDQVSININQTEKYAEHFVIRISVTATAEDARNWAREFAERFGRENVQLSKLDDAA